MSQKSISIFLLGLMLTCSINAKGLCSESECVHHKIPGTGSSVLPISGTSGNWTASFTLESGQEYIGKFSL